MLLGAIVNFQSGFEFISQPAAPANKTDSFPALQQRGDGVRGLGIAGQGGRCFSCEDKAGKEARASILSAGTTAHFSSGLEPFTGSCHPVRRDAGSVRVKAMGCCGVRHRCFLPLLLNLSIVVLQQEERDR